MLAEFQSVVDALDCTVKMQDAIAVANEQEPTESWSRTAISSAMA
jgi:hypothetical protein